MIREITPTKEKACAPTQAIPKQLNVLTLVDGARVQFTSSRYDTLNALTLALLLKGRDISTPAFTYWPEVNATRLPAYIQSLENAGLDGWIYSAPLPLTARQKRARHHKPFHHYWLNPKLIAQAASTAQHWADRVIRWHEVRQDKFGHSQDYADHLSAIPAS